MPRRTRTAAARWLPAAGAALLGTTTTCAYQPLRCNEPGWRD
ncbi:hypothetical protein AB0B85_11430 [Micromonospora sp. NPDC049044]